MRPFVHLHTHSEFSLLDGFSRIKDLVNKAKANHMPALAITDHGNMFGAVTQYNACVEAGIKPILGCEVYVAAGSRFDKKKSRKTSEGQRKTKSAFHLVLLCQNETGYRNLAKLVSLGFTEGFYYKPRVDRELLERYHEGLICLTACLGGEVNQHLLAGDEDEAFATAKWLRDVYGPEHFYLEIQNHNQKLEQEVIAPNMAIAKKLGVGVVATNDSHYTHHEEWLAHDLLLTMQTQEQWDNPNRWRFPEGGQFFFKTGDEMAEMFPGMEEALENTLKIAEACQFQLIDPDPAKNKYHIPRFDVPAGHTDASYFAHVAREGLERRKPTLKKMRDKGLLKHDLEEYEDRLAREIEVINQMGFPGYFLITWDFIDHAKQQDIPVGPGRGSAAGSLVSYAMGITDIDPMRYDLLFERFLNPERVSMPDIDIDFCQDKRDLVIEYVANKYGRDNVCQIITYNTMKSKMVLKDVGRAMGFKPFETDKITKTISDDLKMTIDKALQESKEFQEIYQQSSRHKELIDMSRQLEGLARNTGVHAAGVIIAPEPVTNFGPLYKDNKKDAPKEVVCLQYAKEEAEKIGLLKFDFLGLKNLTTIQRTLELIEESLGFRLDLDAAIADFSDPSTYELFQNGETEGVFQFESSGMKRLLRQLKPTRFEDFIALNALYRPGPLGSGMDQLFIERAHGAKVSYELPALKPILEETHGVILYQEQVMKIAQVLGGFTLGQADELRRAMGKKKIEVMDRMKQTFLEGAKEKGFPEDACARIFDQMAEFAKYGFNKSHSAAYSLISYKTAYLKANYPIYFMTALLSMDKDRTEKIVHYMDRCHAMGIQVQPPDFRFSRDSFSVEGKTIRFGLGAIKGLGDAAIRSILSIPNRHEVDSFESIFEHLDFKTINKSILIKLIHSGAMDFCNQPRQAMAEAAEAMMAWGAQVQKERQGGQMTLFDLDPEMKRCFVQIGTQEYPRQELLKLEKDVLGLYLTGHPLADYLDLIEKTTNFTTIELPDKQDNDLVTIAGVLQELTRRTTKRGDDMASFKILDHKGSCDAVLFPEAFAQVRHLLQADELYVFKGHISREQVAVIECIPLQEWVRYCQDNPAQHVQEKVKGTTSGDTTTFAKTAIGERLSLGALLHSVQTRELKRGQEMAMLRLEDERGALEGVVYPKTLKQLKHKLKEGEILIFSGCVGQGKFGPQFEIEDVYNIAQWQERRYRQCTLSLPDSTPDTLVEELVHYTSRHPGQCRIHLMIRSQDESILVELPQSFLPDQSFPALLAPYDDIKVTFQ